MIYLFKMVILPSYVSSKRKVNCAVVKLPVVVEPTNFDFYITRGYHGKSQHFFLKKMVRKNPRDPEEVENSREFSFSRCGALAVGSFFLSQDCRFMGMGTPLPIRMCPKKKEYPQVTMGVQF